MNCSGKKRTKERRKSMEAEYLTVTQASDLDRYAKENQIWEP